jgi:peptidoglycan/xylan/chitin deacetylase (PgdA/CDA1 family)/Tol biopolymer transport system component
MILVCFLTPLMGETSFSRPEINEKNILLFQADNYVSYYKGNYSALIKSDLETNSQTLLTYYPEEYFFSSDSGELFLWNRFGFYIFNETGKSLPQRVDVYPSLETGSTVQLGKLAPVNISPDGRYLLYYRKEDWSRGDLILYDRERGFNSLITTSVTMDYDGRSIAWSDDSRFFAYVKEGSLYYVSIEKFLEGRLPEEETRRLGKGSPGSFKWGQENSLYFIVDKEVLSVRSNEMFALSFYDSPLQVGTVAGQLFFDFNANFDSFWISPDRNNLLIKREGGALFLVNLEFRNYNDFGEIKRFPFLKLPVGQDVKKVLWADSGKLFFLVGGELDDKQGNDLYIYDPDSSLDSFVETKQESVIDIALSPDQKNIAILYGDELNVRDSQRWTLLRSHSLEDNQACYWKDERNILILGKETSSLYNISEDRRDVLFFSQAGDFGFSLDGSIQLTSEGQNYILDEETRSWGKTDDPFYSEKSINSEDYRVFLTENNHPVIYRNLIMVRSTREFGTRPLLEDLEQERTSLDRYAESSTESVFFNNGSRTRRREVSLVFNINSEITGLMDVLNVLAEYGIKATFFINGDSIRKYPQAIKALAETGNELGSLFYTVLDMTDRKYNIDKDFIMRGLARNEDEFFRATGKDLLPLWHAPWYFVNTNIVEASEEMNYTYVGRDIETLDWVDRDDDFLYYDSDEIINRIGEQIEPGSIIPLTIGSESDRGDYVFQNLELLLNGLIKEGYQIVPVGILMENDK